MNQKTPKENWKQDRDLIERIVTKVFKGFGKKATPHDYVRASLEYGQDQYNLAEERFKEDKTKCHFCGKILDYDSYCLECVRKGDKDYEEEISQLKEKVYASELAIQGAEDQIKEKDKKISQLKAELKEKTKAFEMSQRMRDIELDERETEKKKWLKAIEELKNDLMDWVISDRFEKEDLGKLIDNWKEKVKNDSGISRRY